MASTNKTTHYNLSQYVGTDKPTYLVDYNGDMSNIDTGIYNAQSKANINESAIGTLANLETSVKTDLVSAINEEKEKTDKIGNLSNLTTTANTDLVSAINEVDSESDTNTSAIGTLTNLETTNKTNLVGAMNEVNSNLPIGSLLLYAGTTAPSKFMICDGSAISRTTYANLFSIIGTTYGTGDGSTTFNLPDLKGRVVVGLDNTQTEFNALGETGGEKTHTLTINEMPSHFHKDAINVGGSENMDTVTYGGAGTQAQFYVNTSTTGGDQAHNNLQPYIVLNYIIRVS